jgi:hypothetical protein
MEQIMSGGKEEWEKVTGTSTQDADGFIKGSRLSRIAVPVGWVYRQNKWDVTGTHEQIMAVAICFVPTPRES